MKRACIEFLPDYLEDLVEQLNDQELSNDGIEELNNCLHVANILSTDKPEIKNSLQNNGVTDPISAILISDQPTDK